MTETNHRKFVVLIGREAVISAPDISSELKAIPGVEVSSESPSYIDILADENVVAREDLRTFVTQLGAELHSSPEAQLIDPLPTNKIP